MLEHRRKIFPFSCLRQVPSGPKEIRMPEELKGDIEVQAPELICQASLAHASIRFYLSQVISVCLVVLREPALPTSGVSNLQGHPPLSA